jgi:serine/threonine-protein kinase
MGTVYRARQTSMNREVALKVIDPSLERDAGAVKRFFREAQLASQLAHPNTVAVIEFGQDPNGVVYLVMELLRGETLTALVHREGALRTERVLRIGVQMCDALVAALAMGIVHRDLKPDNVILLEGGRDHVKVLDFGLARSLIDPASAITAQGVVAGTPRYMAPEIVLRGAQPAPQQDIYALGVMLGELATGGELWKADTIDDLFFQKAAGTLALAGLSGPLDALLRAMIAVDPTARPDAGTVRAELLAIERATPAAASPRDPNAMMPDAIALLAIEPAGSPLGGATAVDAVPAGAAARAALEVEPTASAFAVLVEPRPSRLVPLDARPRTGEPSVRKPFGGGLDLPPGGPPPASAFVEPIVPRELTAPKALEVDAEWEAARAEKRVTPIPSPLATRKSSAPRLFAALVVLLVIGGGSAIVAMFAHRPARVPDAPLANTVVIHVVAPAPVDVQIDGARAGKTPFTLSYKRGRPPILITAEVAGHPVARQVSPDHDQTVDLGEP